MNIHGVFWAFLNNIIPDNNSKTNSTIKTNVIISPKRVEILSHNMEAIRKRQQEIHIQKAKAAKDAQQKKKLEDMERKRIATPMELKRRGQKLGHGAITT